jgi:hypothetical protein
VTTRLKAIFEMIKENKILVLFYIISIAPYSLYIFKLPLSPAGDWNYFNSLGLVIGEALRDFRMPLLDPWVCGGVDILSNPQNWIYSPLVVLNLFFNPYIANLLALLICSVFGYWGMLKLSEEMEGKYERYLISALFNLSPFFFLHFAEGHIVYRSFYFLPFVLHLSNRFNTLSDLWWLLLILAGMFLDGGLYPLYFSIILVVFNTNYLGLFGLFSDRRNTKILVIIGVGISFLLLAKILPVLYVHYDRSPVTEAASYSLTNIIQAFFDIRQSNYLTMKGQKFFFHEYGHYLGLGFTAVFISLIPKMKTHKKIIIQFFLYGWIALGLGGVFNPWTIIKSIPFINHMHVQSRVLILFYLMMLVLIIKVYSSNRWRRWLLHLAIIEIVACGGHASYYAFKYSISMDQFKLAQTSLPIEHYVKSMPKPEVYSSRLLSHECYEPAKSQKIRPYSNLFFNLDQGAKAIFTNESIDFITDMPLDKSFILNYNWNGGWTCLEGCKANSVNGLIEIHPTKIGAITIKYDPLYWQVSLVYFLIGIFFMIVARKRISET